MNGVVVDTSVWIDFLAGETIVTLEEALARGAVVIPPIVVAEPVSGAHRASERNAIIGLMDELPLHDATRAHWVCVGELRRHLRVLGLTVSTPDAHVAQCALDRDAPLLTRDGVFARIARHSPLKLATA